MGKYLPRASIQFGRVAAVVAALAVGCSPAGLSTSAVVPKAELPDAPKGEAIADPDLREAREQFDATLTGLLADSSDKKPDTTPSRLAEKLKDYQSYSVKSQKLDRPGAAEFDGTLQGSSKPIRFSAMFIKQKDGTWVIGSFSGPADSQ